MHFSGKVRFCLRVMLTQGNAICPAACCGVIAAIFQPAPSHMMLNTLE